jgi:LysM domain
MPVDSGFVHLISSNPKLDLTLRLAPDPPVFGGGFEGWEVVPRPRDDSMTIWRGNTSLQMSFGAVFDGLVGHRSQEDAIRDLIRCARGGVRDHPGIISVEGIPGTIADEWVIENLEWGDQIRRQSDMHRIRQFVNITIRQYEPPEYKRVRFKSLAKPRRKVVIKKVRKGDTPRKIAKRQNCTWLALKRLNPGKVKGPNQKLKVGMKLRMPVKIKPHNKNK